MKKGKKNALIAAAVLIAAGFAIGGVSLKMIGFNVRQLEVARSETAVQTAEGEIRTLDIRTKLGSVILTPSQESVCTVTSCLPERIGCTVAVEDGTLTVRETDVRNWFDRLAAFTDERSIRIALPAGTYDALRVISDVGDVQIPAGFTFGTATIVTDTGDVALSAAVQDTLRITTDTGDVTAKQISPQSLSLQTDTGVISLRDVHAKADAALQTETGNMLLNDLTCANLTAQSETGTLALRSVIAEGNIQLTSDTGDVVQDGCDAAEITIQTDTGDVIGTLLTDKIFLVSTDTGRVDVPESTTGGKCTIRTDTGNVAIRIAPASEE